MKVTVTTPTGNVGRVVAETLLDEGLEVVLLVRDQARVTDLLDRGAVAFEGCLEDADFLREATRDTEALFFVTPPLRQSEDVRAMQNKLGRTAASAIRANQIPRVVNLSSLGVQAEEGVGPIAGLADVEQHLEQVAHDITHVRPSMFSENFLASLPTMREGGTIFLPVDGNTSAPFVATADVGKTCALELADESWSGRRVVELVGPEDLTFDQAAEVFSEVLGTEIRHVAVTPVIALESLIGAGFSEDSARGIVEIYGALAEGTLEPVDWPTPAETTLIDFAHATLAPAWERIVRI